MADCASALTHMHRCLTTLTSQLAASARLTHCLFRHPALVCFRRLWSEDECELCLWSAVLSVDGRRSVEFESSTQFKRSALTDPQLMQAAAALGERVGHQLRENGAEEILADIR